VYRSQLWWRSSAERSVSRPVAVPPAGGIDSYPMWAPSGATIAFTRYVPGATVQQDRALVCLVRLGQRHVQMLTDGANPDWSPDGKTIVFVRRDGLWTIGADGRRLRRLTTVAPGAQFPHWSPGGGRIAYFDSGANGGPALRILELRTLTNTRVESAPISMSALAWSPDGRSIAYALTGSVQQGPYTEPTATLVARRLDTGNVTRLLSPRLRLSGVAWEH
jgi:Tol biopolymer transport system component